MRRRSRGHERTPERLAIAFTVSVFEPAAGRGCPPSSSCAGAISGSRLEPRGGFLPSPCLTVVVCAPISTGNRA
jgi:hypothetical protein